MHIFSLIAHPRPNSFCHAISDRVRTRILADGHIVEHHDLYAENFDPCLKASEAYTVGDSLEKALRRSEDPIIREHREHIGLADGLLIVHPNWWGKPPAILAGWLDRVLVPGIAYRLETADGRPTPLLKIKTALVFNTSDTEAERERLELGDPLEAIWGRCVLPYCGIEDCRRRVFGPVVGSMEVVRKRWLENAEQDCTAAFPSH